ncbi:MAG TPA: hypothetical protein VNW47_17200 [Terriglobales bacterium]|nr:hypothetical protein [Terriglobales bacterium]
MKRGPVAPMQVAAFCNRGASQGDVVATSANGWGQTKRAFGSIGICLLVIAAGYYSWSSSIASASRLRGGKQIEIRAAAGKLDVAGTSDADVRVTIENVSAESAKTARIKIDRNRNPILIDIDDLPQFATAFVEVPRAASLAVSMGAGDLHITGVDGDKLCLLRTGKMSIDVGEPEAYKSVRGFVLAGDLHAPAFNREKGGLWRMMHWKGKGKTILDAHVGTGMLELQ